MRPGDRGLTNAGTMSQMIRFAALASAAGAPGFDETSRTAIDQDYARLGIFPVTGPAVPGGDPPNDRVGAGRILASGQLLVWLRSGR